MRGDLYHPPAEVISNAVFFFFFFWVTGELSALRQMMEVPNEPGLCPNTGLENTSQAISPRQVRCPLYASWCYQRYQTNVRCVKHRPYQNDKAISPQEGYSKNNVS